MDFLHVDGLVFPVRHGKLSKLADEASDYCWSVEVDCGPSERTDASEKEEEDLAWILGAEPYLYAQMLPFRVASPDELLGKSYSFPQSPDDNPADWAAPQWPFFCLYAWEHEYAHPMTIAFTGKQNGQYRIEVSGMVTMHKAFDLRAQAWLRWEQ